MNPAFLACGGWLAAAVGTAAELGVADLLKDGPLPVTRIAQLTGAQPDALMRVLRLLTTAGVFELTGEYCANNQESERLITTHPLSVRAFCQLAAGDYQRVFTELRHTVMTGEPATSRVFGSSLYDHLAARPEAASVYHSAMEDLSRGTGIALARSRDWSAVQTVTDIGAGRGGLLGELLSIHPHLHGICFDRDAAVDSTLAKEAVSDGRLRQASGDFFVAVPAGADVYILKNVLHNWSDAQATRILRVVASALVTPAARILILEPPDVDGSSMYAALDALMQAVVCESGSGPRTEARLGALVTAADLKVVGGVPLASGHLMIEASRQ